MRRATDLSEEEKEAINNMSSAQDFMFDLGGSMDFWPHAQSRVSAGDAPPGEKTSVLGFAAGYSQECQPSSDSKILTVR